MLPKVNNSRWIQTIADNHRNAYGLFDGTMRRE
jgi:hypothetical protein